MPISVQQALLSYQTHRRMVDIIHNLHMSNTISQEDQEFILSIFESHSSIADLSPEQKAEKLRILCVMLNSNKSYLIDTLEGVIRDLETIAVSGNTTINYENEIKVAANELIPLMRTRLILDLEGRGYREKEYIIRYYIHAFSNLINNHNSLLEDNNKVLDLSKIDLSNINLSGLNLSIVNFGNSNLSGCNLVDTNVRTDQLRYLKRLDCILADEVKEKILDVRFSDRVENIKKLYKILNEARSNIDCLDSLYLLSCRGSFNTSKLDQLTDDDLKRISFIAMCDPSINLLDVNSALSSLNIHENRDYIFSASRDALYIMLNTMLDARRYNLSVDVIGMSIDGKLYGLYNNIADSFLHIGDIEESISEFSIDKQTFIRAQLDDLKQLRKKYIADQEVRKDTADKRMINNFLESLNDPVDDLLNLNPTERLKSAIKLSERFKGMDLDLRNLDLNAVDFTKIFEVTTNLILTPEQEAKFPSEYIQRKYALFFDMIKAGNIEAVDQILKNRICNVDTPDPAGRTPLMISTSYKQYAIVKLLVEKYNASINSKTPTGWTAFQAICRMRYDNPISAQEEMESKMRIASYLKSKGAETSVHDLAELGDVESISNYNRQTLESCDVMGDAVVHIASKNNKIEILDLLKRKAVDIKASNQTGKNALHIACEYGHLEMVRELIKFQFDINKEFRGRSPIFIAVMAGKFDVALLLKNAGATLRIDTAVALKDSSFIENSIKNASPTNKKDLLEEILLASCKYLWIEKVEEMLNKGVNINARVKMKTPLDIALEHDDSVLLSTLLKYRDTLVINDNSSGYPPVLFQMICDKKWDKVITLLDIGADPNITYNNKNMLYWVLSEYGDNDSPTINVITKMLSKGAHIAARDLNGNTALHYAAEKGEVFFNLVLNSYIFSHNNAGISAYSILTTNNGIPASTVLNAANRENIESKDDQSSLLHINSTWVQREEARRNSSSQITLGSVDI